MKLTDKLLNASRKKSWLCIRLDPDPELMPAVDLLQFNKTIIASAFNLNAKWRKLTMQHAYLYY
jgi:hypothetical protein